MTLDARREVRARVNGRQTSVQVHTTTMLADLLRDDLGLTGTKVSCDMQVCGACAVLVDGHPVSACTYLAIDVHERDVVTVEGLASSDGSLSELQQSFIDRFALQCGFCTPGFLMMATALLGENPRPTETEVREYLEGSICRCSGYRPIVDAILAVCEGRGGTDGA
jgi:aerobic-type carbon monoxide dehydrogenase small subunit (CoxS/CutS family)